MWARERERTNEFYFILFYWGDRVSTMHTYFFYELHVAELNTAHDTVVWLFNLIIVSNYWPMNRYL